MKRYFLIWCLMVITAYGYSQQFSVSILYPTKNQLIGNKLDISVSVQSTMEIITVLASVENQQSNLIYNNQTGLFEGSLSLSSLIQDTLTLNIKVTDIDNNSYSKNVQFIYDTPPNISVITPLNYSLARPTAKFNISCSEQNDKDCRMNVSIESSVIIEGGSEIIEEFDLSDYEGSQITLLFTAIDDRNQRTSVSRVIYVESSPFLKQIEQVAYPISDFDGNNLLYAKDTVDAEVYDLNTSGIITIPFGDRIQSDNLFLTNKGVIFQRFTNSSLGKGLYEWTDNTINLLTSSINSNYSVTVSGDYIIWSEGKNLFRRELSNGTTTIISNNAGNWGNDVSMNGEVAYWDNSYDIHFLKDNIDTKLTNASVLWNTYVKTNGDLLIYRKHDPCCTNQKYALVIHDGVEEIILRDFQDREDTYGSYQINNQYIAYGRLGNIGQNHIWIRESSGENHQITYFGNDSKLELLNSLGDVCFINDDRYLSDKLGNKIKVSSGLGKIYWEENEWYVSIGTNLLQIDISVEKHTVNDISKTIFQDSSLTFSKLDFLNAYNGSGSLIKISIIDLPKHGTLKLNGIRIDSPTEIKRTSIDDLKYIPNSSYYGKDSMIWNASNGLSFADENSKIDIQIKNALSLKELKSNSLFTIYPNPAKNILNISATTNSSNKLSLTIYDMEGRIVMVKSFYEKITQETGYYTVDVTDLTPGLYVLKLCLPESIEYRRFIKI